MKRGLRSVLAQKLILGPLRGPKIAFEPKPILGLVSLGKRPRGVYLEIKTQFLFASARLLASAQSTALGT